MKASTGLAAALILAGVTTGATAFAQTAQKGSQAEGTTSGPATGTNVEPSTVTQKKAPGHDADAASAGAPGKEGVKGGESGTKPRG